MKKIVSPKSVLTPADLTALINKMKFVFPTRDEVREIVKEEIKFLPTKDEFFTRMDKLSKEIQDARQELAAHSISHDRLDEKDDELDVRLKHVEKRLGVTAAIPS